MKDLKDVGGIKRMYNFLNLLGQGTFGEVYLVEDKSSKQNFVVKVIKKGTTSSLEDQYIKYLEEVDNMSKLDHPNIVKIYHIFEDIKTYYIVME